MNDKLPSPSPADEAHMADLHSENAQLSRDIDRLSTYIEALDRDINRMRTSLTWRLVARLVACARLALGRQGRDGCSTDIDKTLALYHHWKKSRG